MPTLVLSLMSVEIQCFNFLKLSSLTLIHYQLRRAGELAKLIPISNNSIAFNYFFKTFSVF